MGIMGEEAEGQECQDSKVDTLIDFCSIAIVASETNLY